MIPDLIKEAKEEGHFIPTEAQIKTTERCLACFSDMDA